MTTLAKPWSNFSNTWADIRGRIAAIKADAPVLLRHLLKSETRWLWVLLPVMVLSVYVYVVNSAVWNGSGGLLLFQPFVPIAVAFAIYSQRVEISETYAELAFVYPDDSPKRRGNLSIVVVGCLFLLSAAFSALSTLAVVGFIITAVGCMYYLFGPMISKILWRPILFLLLMIPPPVSYLMQVSGHMQTGTAVVAGQILHLFIHDVQIVGPVITLPGFLLEVTPECGGLGVLLPVVALSMLLATFRQLTVYVAVIIVIIGVVIALFLNVFRVVAIGMLSSVNPDIANAWMAGTPILLTLFAYYLTYLASNAILSPQRRLSEFEQDLLLSTQYAQNNADAESNEG